MYRLRPRRETDVMLKITKKDLIFQIDSDTLALLILVLVLVFK